MLVRCKAQQNSASKECLSAEPLGTFCYAHCFSLKLIIMFLCLPAPQHPQSLLVLKSQVSETPLQ